MMLFNYQFSSIHHQIILLPLLLLAQLSWSTATITSLDHYKSHGNTQIVELVPGQEYDGTPSDKTIYCKDSYQSKPLHAWARSFILFTSESRIKQIVDGRDTNEIKDKENNRSSIWRSLFFLAKPNLVIDSYTLPYFEPRCFSLITDSPYGFTFHSSAFDSLLFGLTMLGVIAFYKAPSYAKSEVFYYICALILGCLGSLLVIFFIISRYVPKKLCYITLIFGYSSIGFIYQLFQERIYQHILDYGSYIFWYTIVAAFITFAFAYRCGPPNNPRTLNLVQWSCQILSLALIMISVSLPPVALTLIAIILVHYNLGNFRVKLPLKTRIEPRALLTEEEYTLQGIFHTQMELEKLREFCQSPNVDAWSIAYRLKNPDRFAKFIVTGQDVGEDERNAYDTSCFEDSEEMFEGMGVGGDQMVVDDCGDKIDETKK